MNENTMLDVDEISFELECGIDALNLIREAMNNGGSSRDYEQGLYCVCQYLRERQETLRKIVDSAVDSRKEESA